MELTGTCPTPCCPLEVLSGVGKGICPVPESRDYLMSWDSGQKINPGPWVGDHFEDG